MNQNLSTPTESDASMAQWAFALTFAGYGIDTLIVLFFADWLGGIFHALGLYYIGRGAHAAYKFNQEMNVIR